MELIGMEKCSIKRHSDSSVQKYKKTTTTKALFSVRWYARQSKREEEKKSKQKMESKICIRFTLLKVLTS